ncbi:hypothetical protein K469DRAFT_147796 [Zopfia rhizophila CBS 207.26]|uniref:Zn(2)-C6 fungal-type domain-containing protein n=1 Tax=Zopfia rhizophila CBS 207.26 TaxID=1314779 RepID=A0A6A6E348_9PEZI|nr:hypothetical protein K469DRAFT_147796 [Zopfia rhizophila CBS 207.26]
MDPTTWGGMSMFMAYDYEKKWCKELRKLAKNASEKPIVPQTVRVDVDIGRYTRTFDVAAENAVLDLAEIGVAIRTEQDEWKPKPEIGDDADSVLGAQSVTNDVDVEMAEDERPDSEPSLPHKPVMESTATQTDEPCFGNTLNSRVTQQESMPVGRGRSCDIATQTNSKAPVASKNLSERSSRRNSATHGKEVEESQMPLAHRHNNNMSQRRAPLISAPTERYLPTPEKHLSDLVEFMSYPPSDNEFGCNYQIVDGWDSLDSPRRAAIAHARCINGRYGEDVDAKSQCTQCSRRGYQCRIYHALFTPIPGMDLGYACQNCRVGENNCDLMPRPNTPSPSTARTASNVDVTQRDEEAGYLISPYAAAPARIVTKKPSRSLESRISNEFRIKGAAAAAAEGSSSKGLRGSSWVSVPHTATLPISLDSPVPTSSHTGITVPESTPKPSNSHGMVITDSDSHGDGTESTVQIVAVELDLSMPRVKRVQSMYNTWMKKGTIQRYNKRGKLTDYYEDLIYLSIVAHHTNDKDLSYSILLKWQEENYRHASTMPNLESIMKAFEYLPRSSSLCQWIIHFYSFLWSTDAHGTYEDFCLQLGIEKRPSESFLYGVAQTRCPFTKGKDIRLLKDWCMLHNHKSDLEERECKMWRDELSKNLLADLIKREEEEELELAKMTVRKHDTTKPITGRVQKNIAKREHDEDTMSPHNSKRNRGSEFHSGGR